ncbi:glycosyltransferase [Desulfurobacterium atlanticum]|uniref:Glycosyltransferase Family 4 n=1 Tax=Desulfurobacterium atlanticum TaxID=240169 RepID=A0A239A9Z7_9BACT|nr:glycosyltransferase [Desulfurobacterium atlanticum]SNR92339.1 Glycosyltransferase Family 4 [Desulfurobacterium atlanticum]
MRNRIRVLEIIDGVGWCGTKEQTFLISCQLSKYFDVEMALASSNRHLRDRLEGKIPLHFFQKGEGNEKFDFNVYKTLYRIIKNGNYDVIVPNSSGAFNFLLPIWPFIKKKPKLIGMRRSGFVPSFLSKKFKYGIADAIVVVSKDVGLMLKEKGFFPDKIHIIESGIDLERFKPSDKYREEKRREFRIRSGEKLFVNVANFQPWRKGQDVLLKAFSKVASSGWRLMLVGHDTDSAEARSLARQFGVEDKVIFAGFRSDIEKILQAADYFVLSSNSEGIAGALLQAMASGKVVISTLAGGIGEYLKDGENGFAVPVGDVDGLADRMVKAVNLSSSQYAEISKRAVETAKKYSIEETGRKWKELIESLCS